MKDLAADMPGVVYTDKAQCRDCYRCVRSCPVKAIRMEQSQAAVAPELCIACGTCVKQCPQSAKKYRRDLALAREIMAGPGAKAASVAPSFAARCRPWQARRLAGALRALGFDVVAETAVGAWHVAAETARYVREHPGRPHITTACPAVVAYVETYHPECLDYLTPIASPMIAHARLLRRRLGRDARVIFIGPCVAKKSEADRCDDGEAVDCALTFEELDEWLDEAGIDLRRLEESAFDEVPLGRARSFPLPGGAMLTAGMDPDMLAADAIAVSGFEELEQMLADLPTLDRTRVIEPLMCRQGCINGPAMGCESRLFSRRAAALAYAADNPGAEAEGIETQSTAARVETRAVCGAARGMTLATDAHGIKITEADIEEVLARTGKTDKADQLDCGACGYDTCREKAIAVLRGLAESEMCIPYMRRMAEQRGDRIIETSPNGIVILDRQLNILSMNPAFRAMFHCGDAVCGKPISYLLNAGLFERARDVDGGAVEQVVRYDAYSLVCHQIVYVLADAGQTVGIFVNITRLRDNQHQLDTLRRETLTHARQLHEQQVDMARRIVEFLGQSTGRSERLLEDLMAMSRGDGGGPGEE